MGTRNTAPRSLSLALIFLTGCSGLNYGTFKEPVSRVQINKQHDRCEESWKEIERYFLSHGIEISYGGDYEFHVSSIPLPIPFAITHRTYARSWVPNCLIGLMLHEIGHGRWRLSHTWKGVMNESLWWLTDGFTEEQLEFMRHHNNVLFRSTDG